MKPSELLKKPGSWCQYAFSEDAEGNWAPRATAQRWCVIGAIDKCYPRFRDNDRAFNKLKAALGIDNILGWNDTSGRTHKQVLAALRKAGL